MAAAANSTSEIQGLGRFWGAIVVLLIAALLGIVGLIGFHFVGKKYFADSARDTLIKAIEESAIPPTEQQEMIAQIDRLTDGFMRGEIGYQAMAQIIMELAGSPVFAVVAVVALETNYILPSGLSDAEKADAHRVMERLARGLVEDLLTEEDLDPVLEVVSKQRAEGEARILKERLADEEIREFLIQAQQLADDAGVPAEPIEVDLGESLRHAVDRALAAQAAKENG